MCLAILRNGLFICDFEISVLIRMWEFDAGWFLSAYFLGGYSENGRGMNGLSKAVFAAAKSWAVGIPVSSDFT